MTWLPMLKLVMFQIVWLACAIGAAQGWSWPGILGAVLLASSHIALAPQRSRAAMTVLAAGTMGLIAESLLVVADLVRYSAPWPTKVLAPAWIVALWLAFGTTLQSAQLLLGSYRFCKAALLGAVLGPFSYFAGERLGALGFAQPPWVSYLTIACVWGIAYPGLLTIEGRLSRGKRIAQPVESGEA